MINYSPIKEYIDNIVNTDPTVGVTVKLQGSGFQLMYITVAKKLQYNETSKRIHKQAIGYLAEVEKGIKKYYKSKTGDSLSFKMIDEQQVHNPTGLLWTYSGDESVYFRIFRNYEITKPKNIEPLDFD